MRIAVDLSGAREEGSGRGTYVRSLLLALAAVDRENQYYLYGNPAQRGTADRANFRYRQYGELAGVEVWHFPDLISPFLRAHAASSRWEGAGLVVTVHDLLFDQLPHEFPEATRRAFRRSLEAALTARASFVVPSEWSCAALAERGVLRERIHVVPLAAAATFAPSADGEALDSFRRRHGLLRPYLLFVGGPCPRKNLGGALRAFGLLRDRKRIPHQLAVVGVTRAQVRGLLAPDVPPDPSLLEEHVVFLGRLSEGDMPLAYNAADLLVYPSRAEGFGLPLLEAMACGLPAVAAAAGALPELAGDAAVLADPDNPEEIAAAVARLLSDRSLYLRLREQGLMRARAFTWDRTARETVAVYRAVLPGRRHPAQGLFTSLGMSS